MKSKIEEGKIEKFSCFQVISDPHIQCPHDKDTYTYIIALETQIKLATNRY